MTKKVIDWDFKAQNTKTYTHCFHYYPAMMIPPIAKHLLIEYGKKAQTIYDPFCGSGTSLVEANLAGKNAIGSDLNPMARLIAKSKTTPIEHNRLLNCIKDFYNFLFHYRFNGFDRDTVFTPTFKNIEYWFSKNVQIDLSIIKNYIDNINEKNIKNFFLVAFSQTIRDCSWTRKNEYKLYRMDKITKRKFRPNVFFTMEHHLYKNKKGLIDFMKQKNKGRSLVYNIDVISPINKIKDKSIDMVLSSPPYGDSKTTVAYGQFSRLTNQWLNEKNPSKLDNLLMGGNKITETSKFKSETLNEQINELFKIDKKRCLEVISFYKDYYQSITNISPKIKAKGFVCYVVSNRTVKGITLLTDVITIDFFKMSGFKHIETFKREISNKRLPKQNSPNGVEGEKSDLMNKEYIIVMQKK